MKFQALVPMAIVTAMGSFSGCGKSVGHEGLSAARQAINEPNPPTIPVGECGPNPFRGFGDHSVFSRGQLIWTDVKTEGRVGALLDSHIQKSRIATTLSNDRDRVDLGVLDTLTVSRSSVLHGRVAAGRRLDYSRLEAPLGQGVENMDSLRVDETRLKALHHYLLSLRPLGEAVVECDPHEQSPECTLVLRGEGARTNVIDVNSQDLHSARRLRFDVPVASTVVVRVNGKKRANVTLHLQEIDLGGLRPDQIVWTTNKVVELVAHRMELPGNWVAPGTRVHANDAVFAGSYLGSCVFAERTSFARNSFGGCLPPNLDP